MTTIAIIGTLLILAACRTKREAVAVVRTADTVATLHAATLRTLERETVWETVTVRPDTNGVLQVVARDIVRFTDRAVEKVADTVMAAVSSVTTEAREETKTTTPARGKRKGNALAVIGIWVLFSAMVLGLALYTMKTWTSRH